MDVDQEPLQPHVPSSQSDVETQPVYWKDSMDEDLRAAVMSVVGRHVNDARPPPTQTTRSSRLLLDSPNTRRPRRSVLSSHPYSPSHFGTSASESTPTATSSKRPRRIRSLPKPIQSGVATIEGGSVPGPSRSKSESENIRSACEDQGSMEGELLDRLIYQVQARLEKQNLIGNGTVIQKITPSGIGGRSSIGKGAPKRDGTVKTTTTHTSAARSAPMTVASPATTPSRVLRDRTRQDRSTIDQAPLSTRKESTAQRMVTRGQPMVLPVNKPTEMTEKTGQPAVKETTKAGYSRTPHSNLPKHSRSLPPPNETRTGTPSHPIERSRANIRGQNYVAALSPPGLRSSVKATTQGLSSQAKRSHSFKTPFLNQPQISAQPSVELEIPAADVEMGGAGNESFDSMDMDTLFLEGGEEVEALLRAYDG